MVTKRFPGAVVRLAALLAVASGAVFATTTAAHAAITDGCAASACWVDEDMGSGYCESRVIYDANFAWGRFENNASGYTCRFWVERDVNGTGWYRISSTYDVTPGMFEAITPNYWDGVGYLARACFQFIWSSTSSGAVHCGTGI